ncbi:MAG TPA: hypothetical protein VGH73_11310 [Thermoanaerobaculia bacterium]|jgi:hypothetical protein
MREIPNGGSSSRVKLLAFLAAMLVSSLALLTPHRAAAILCGVGQYPGTWTTYYTDASRTTVSCETTSCTGDPCDPTPYYRTKPICCPE